MSTGIGRAADLKQRIITLLRGRSTNYRGTELLPGLTADEIAYFLKESALSIRPRLTELKQTNRIIATGERRQNESGKWAAVWEIYEPVSSIGDVIAEANRLVKQQ